VTHLVVDLDDPAVLDPMVGGAKAAWLARGRGAGLPVLPGLVVAAAASERSIGMGRERLQSGGSGLARLAISERGLPEEVAIALAGVELGWVRLVVRSSSVLEDAGEWSGAFASYLDVGAADLTTAIVGCWTSTFSVATLERYRQAGKEPAPLAVIVQPFVVASAGGTAEVNGTSVIIHAVDGSPEGLVSGHRRGRTSVYDRTSGSVQEFPNPIVEAVVRLAFEAHKRIGANSMEWAAGGNGEIFILQLAKWQRPAVTDDQVVVPDHPDLTRVARIVRRFPGGLGAELVLPWALASTDPELLDGIPALTVSDPPLALAEASTACRVLTNRVWGSSDGKELAKECLAELAGDPAAGLSRIGRLCVPLTGEAARVIGLIRGAGVRLRQQGVIGHPDEVWYLDLSQMRSSTLRLGVGRWEPLGAAVTAAHGVRAGGIAASAGIGFGRARLIHELPADAMGPRQVIVAREPIPHLASLLWSAAGLVTFDGSPAAHLFEAARSLGVPAVAAVDLDPVVMAAGEWGVAVDGSRGAVAIMEW